MKKLRLVLSISFLAFLSLKANAQNVRYNVDCEAQGDLKEKSSIFFFVKETGELDYAYVDLRPSGSSVSTVSISTDGLSLVSTKQPSEIGWKYDINALDVNVIGCEAQIFYFPEIPAVGQKFEPIISLDCRGNGRGFVVQQQVKVSCATTAKIVHNN
jgi:hypothetical protein